MSSAAANVTKVNLELGGKAPAVVLNDADIDLAVGAITASRVINSGQVCNCAERIYVDKRVSDEFVTKISAEMSKTSYGDPRGDEDVDMGPLINVAGLNKVEGLVSRAIDDGAKLVTGGKIADLGSGNYYEPTVLTDCRQDMEIMQKEIFGPVVPVNIFDSLDQAIERANDSAYGLTSSIYTSDIAQPCAPAMKFVSAKPTSTARTSRRCRAFTPAFASLELAVPTASTAFTNTRNLMSSTCSTRLV